MLPVTALSLLLSIALINSLLTPSHIESLVDELACEVVLNPESL